MYKKIARKKNFSSKWSLIHTNDAPWKYFEFWPPVFYIWTFPGLDLSFAPPILAKVIFRNRHCLYTKKSQASKFLLKVIAYTYLWCSVKVFWVLTACFLYYDLFRFGFVICTAELVRRMRARSLGWPRSRARGVRAGLEKKRGKRELKCWLPLINTEDSNSFWVGLPRVKKKLPSVLRHNGTLWDSPHICIQKKTQYVYIAKINR